MTDDCRQFPLSGHVSFYESAPVFVSEIVEPL